LLKKVFNRVRNASQKRFGVKPLSQSIPRLQQWQASPLGRALLKEEQEQIDHVINYLFGYHLMQLSIASHTNLSRNSTINHCFGFSPVVDSVAAGDFERTSENAKATEKLWMGYADPERMPLRSESIDVAVLHHVLDFTQNPHHLLRETARVLIPRGYVVIVGFNPLSCFGLSKLFGRLFTSGPLWRHHSLRLGRVIDWLRLLDFEPVEVSHGYFRFPINSQRFISRTQWYERFMKKIRLPLGSFYLILARKDVVAMTPIKPMWKKFNPMEGLVGTQHRTPSPSPPLPSPNQTQAPGVHSQSEIQNQQHRISGAGE
jgi:SAM-dependent methyltransferase